MKKHESIHCIKGLLGVLLTLACCASFAQTTAQTAPKTMGQRWNNKTYIGMTCAACHTRQIEVAGTSYRIDGGPAITDFQSFLSDLDTAVDRALNDDADFNQFAIEVLGGV